VDETAEKEAAAEAETDLAASAPRPTGTIAVKLWQLRLWLAGGGGVVLRWLVVDGRGVSALLLLAPAGVFALEGHWLLAGIFAGVWLLLMLAIAARAARDRLLVGDFTWFPEAVPGSGAGEAPRAGPPIDIANLLLVEISRLADLFRVVGDRRAVESGLGQERALDATLSVNTLVENLQGTFGAEAKANLGPLTIPLGPLITLFGKLIQAPRLSGALHRDGEVLILTAQMTRRGLSWLVQPREPEEEEPKDVETIVSDMVGELALRIYTDIALGRAVRWQASRCFVRGLRSFRASLRSPRDRKYNLKQAEEQFLKALAEDEDFPLVYYNLGVVYTELHGLAVTGGRKAEAETRLSAAETSFGRAIEKDPTRWEPYFAFAQTQFRYSHWDSVVQLCSHIVEELEPDRSARAKSHELWARALLRRKRDGDYAAALSHARSASKLGLKALSRARLLDASSAKGEDTPESRCAELAAGCVLTFSDIYSRQMPKAAEMEGWGWDRLRQERISRRAEALAALAPVSQGSAQVRYDFGRRLLRLGHVDEAIAELRAAVRSDPTRPSFSARLALARARALAADGRKATAEERDEIVGLCLRALQGMAGAFFPSRDADATRTVAKVYDCLGSEDHDDHTTAEQLEIVAEKVDDRLGQNVGGSSVSSVFLEVLQSANIPLSGQLGEYGEAARKAKYFLVAGQEKSGPGIRHLARSRFREALVQAERATSLNPLSTLAWETLGDVHHELSDFRNARNAWQQALSTDPDNPRLYDKIGSSFWNIAFQARARASNEDLDHAYYYFERALVLYGSGSFADKRLTHYRLGKLHTAKREFGEARRHLEIVEAAEEVPPLVGWEQLGFAYLEEQRYADAEYYFGRIVREGNDLAHDARTPLGERLDEQLWPFALVRAWGHLGLAITLAERDGDLDRARAHLQDATARLAELGLDEEDPASDPRFPTRAPAALHECHGLILLRERDFDGAIEELKTSVSMFPHSRAYFELALALEQRAAAHPEERDELMIRAQRLIRHGESLRPPTPPFSSEIRAAIERIGHPTPAEVAVTA
jgi:tetratricopeptide (TPR) repeat protein